MPSARRRYSGTAIALLIAATAVGSVIIGLLAGGSQASSATTAPPEDLISGLAASGKTFVPATPTDEQEARITPAEAVELAAKAELGGQVSEGLSITPYLGRLTEQDRLGPPPADTPKPAEGDDLIPAPAVDQLVYAVQVNGVIEYPHGGVFDESRIHHELIVFIDSVTGKEVLATTFR